MTKAVQDLMVAVERVRDAFHAAVFTSGHLEAAVALLDAEAVLDVVPAGSAVHGAAAIREHLRDELLPGVPDDLAFRRVSRTGDRWRVVDEEVLSFTHDRAMPWLLPGAEPTGRRAEVLVVSIVEVRRDRIRRHRMLVDHATLLADLGLEPARPVR